MLNEMYKIGHISSKDESIFRSDLIKILLTLRESLEIAFGIVLQGHRGHEPCQLCDQRRPSCSRLNQLTHVKGFGGKIS